MNGDDWTMTHATATEHLPGDLRSACPGVFRVESNDGKRPAVAVCDVCGESMGVRQRDLVPQPARQEEMAW